VRIGRRTSAKRITLVACAALATCVVGGSQGHASPEPDIESAQERVDDLYHQAEQASERFNELRTDLRAARTRLSALQTDVDAQREVVDTLTDEVGDIVAAQAQGTPAGPTAQLISSGDPDAFLAGLAAMQAYSVKQNDLLDTVEAQQAELRLRAEQLQDQVDAIGRAKLEMAEHRAVIDEKFGEATALLEELEAAERAAVEAAQRSALPQPDPGAEAGDDPTGDATSGDAPTDDPQEQPQGEQPQVPDVPAPSGNAQAAIDFALAQLGDAYVYGAAGPDAWDCSGLTMGAWSAAGVALPHASSVQAGMGTAVSYEDLQPGDLVFYYSPISHVGLYIGDGQLVHAPNPSSVVEIVDVDLMPITSIRRVG
jgi:cell wall-associated NlpC family hydrolase